jgi:hypothetical protein
MNLFTIEYVSKKVIATKKNGALIKVRILFTVFVWLAVDMQQGTKAKRLCIKGH